MPNLHITLANGQTQTHALGDAPVVLGREPACDIPLFDLSASRRHVEIRPDQNGYLLRDLGSKNGTLVNDQLTKQVVLHGGDEIWIGAIRVVYHDDAPKSSNDWSAKAVDATNMSNTVVVSDAPTHRQPTTYRGQPEALRLSRQRLETLYSLNERLTRLRERDELLTEALDSCFELMRFERGAIGIKKPEGQLVDWPVVRNLRGAGGELTISRTILASALRDGERVIVNDTAAEFDPTMSIVQQGVCSAMCVPLMSGDEILGVIYGDRTSTAATYTEEDVDFFSAIARLVSIGLINARLLNEQRRMAEMDAEISTAREIQTGLFPKSLPDCDSIRIFAVNDPGRRVSGDYYDVIERDDGRITFLIADVTGEGVAASLIMANLQAAVRVTLQSNEPLESLANRWNQLLCDNTDVSRFVTALVATIDPRSRELEMVCAGHYSPIEIRTGKPPRSLELDSDIPLGIMDDTAYACCRVTLSPGPVSLLVYTDGVVEAMNQNMTLFGSERLMEIITGAPDIDPAQLVRAVRQAVHRFAGNQPQSDDITIMAVHLP